MPKKLMELKRWHKATAIAVVFLILVAGICFTVYELVKSLDSQTLLDNQKPLRMLIDSDVQNPIQLPSNNSANQVNLTLPSRGKLTELFQQQQQQQASSDGHHHHLSEVVPAHIAKDLPSNELVSSHASHDNEKLAPAPPQSANNAKEVNEHEEPLPPPPSSPTSIQGEVATKVNESSDSKEPAKIKQSPKELATPPPPPPTSSPPPPPPPPVATKPIDESKNKDELHIIAMHLLEWDKFKLNFGKNYTNREEESRRALIFLDNLSYINKFNLRTDVKFTLGINQFADMTRDEINSHFVGPMQSWAQLMNSLESPIIHIRTLATPGIHGGAIGEPTRIDLRNWLQGPENQGECRDSAAYAVSASLLAAQNMKANSHADLDTKQLLDCLRLHRRSGEQPICSGHQSMVQVFDTLQSQEAKLTGRSNYASYQRNAMDPSDKDACTLRGLDEVQGQPFVSLQSRSYVHHENILEALTTVGPLTFALDGSQSSFHFYKSGLYHELECSTEHYNHHLLLVGFNGRDPEFTSHQSFVARNSFGKAWGDNGDIRLMKDTQLNRCLPQHFAIYPILREEEDNNDNN